MFVGFRRREKGKLLRRRGNMRLLSRWLRLRRDKKAARKEAGGVRWKIKQSKACNLRLPCILLTPVGSK
jgi:hypothetical protein